MTAERKAQIEWVLQERELELSHIPRQTCVHCKTHRSWSTTCKQCLAEAFHKLMGTWISADRP